MLRRGGRAPRHLLVGSRLPLLLMQVAPWMRRIPLGRCRSSPRDLNRAQDGAVAPASAPSMRRGRVRNAAGARGALFTGLRKRRRTLPTSTRTSSESSACVFRPSRWCPTARTPVVGNARYLDATWGSRQLSPPPMAGGWHDSGMRRPTPGRAEGPLPPQGGHGHWGTDSVRVWRSASSAWEAGHHDVVCVKLPPPPNSAVSKAGKRRRALSKLICKRCKRISADCKDMAAHPCKLVVGNKRRAMQQRLQEALDAGNLDDDIREGITCVLDIFKDEAEQQQQPQQGDAHQLKALAWPLDTKHFTVKFVCTTCDL